MSRSRRRTGFLTAGALLAAALLLVLIDGPEVRAPATLAAVAALLLGLHLWGRGPRGARAALAAFGAVTALLFVLPVVSDVARNLRRLPEWDFLGFWLHARTAVLGGDFYDPAWARELARPFDPSDAFRREIVDAGFWYPPPSMLLFWPLGWFEHPAAALAPWYGLHAAFLAVAVVLAWKTFFSGKGAAELSACAALVCIGHGTYSTFHFSQTNFAALLALLLFWRSRGTLAGGAWLPVAVLVKPLLAAVAIGPLLARRWKAVAGMALSSAALMLASLWGFGADAFLRYFARGPREAKPDWIYDEPTNQSLLGLVLRATDADCAGGACVTNPVFLGGAAILGAVTLLLGIGLQRAGEDEWTLALVLPAALIVYPVSQLFYSVLLLPPLLAFWRRREDVAGGAWTLAVLIATVYALAAVDRGRWTVLAYLLTWVAAAAFGVRFLRRPRVAAEGSDV
jgi:hypothetical protein